MFKLGVGQTPILQVSQNQYGWHNTRASTECWIAYSFSATTYVPLYPLTFQPGLAETTQSVQQVPGAKVKSKLDSAKCQTFQKCFAALSNGISDPGWLASELYSREMISSNLRQEAQLETLPAPTRTIKLLLAVENQIKTSPTSKFRNFLYILHSEPSLEHLARKLEEACSKLKFSVSLVLHYK